MPPKATQPHLFVFGLGYSAIVIARQLLAEGWRVSGTCREQGKAESLREIGIRVFLFDEHTQLPDINTTFAGVTHLLGSIPPDDRGDPSITQQGQSLLAADIHLQWIGYLSTVGVYGDHQGAWIDETCPVNPLSEDSKRRVKAENQWLELGQQLGVQAHLFRLPGIYGPNGRSQIDALRAGRARRIVKPGQVFNRIHVADLANVVIASMHKLTRSTVFNVTDDEPAPADLVVAHAAKLMGIEPPSEVPFESANLPPFAKHFYAECKRVRNERIKEELGISLKYPTYREGLAAILAETP